jgi:hypothetical protein
VKTVLARYNDHSIRYLGGQVVRFHTRPGMGQSVAEHSFNMASLALRLWPDCRKELLVAILEHDLGEVIAGDTPSPVKRGDEVFGLAYKRVCAIVDSHYHLDGAHHLNPMEHRWLKCLDILEAMHWALHCARLGNQFSHDVCRELDKVFDQWSHSGFLVKGVLAEWDRWREDVRTVTGAVPW